MPPRPPCSCPVGHSTNVDDSNIITQWQFSNRKEDLGDELHGRLLIHHWPHAPILENGHRNAHPAGCEPRLEHWDLRDHDSGLNTPSKILLTSTSLGISRDP